MWVYAARRILYAIPIALGVSVVCFGLIFLAPGDPVQSLLPPDATEEDAALIRSLYGLDQPIPIQYATWLFRAVQGDLGISLQTNKPVTEEVLRALGNTMSIAVGAVLIAFVIAFILGTVAAYNNGRIMDRIATSISAVGVSIPNYWLGIVLVIVFAVFLRWLPATGMGKGGSDTFNWFDWESVKYALMPMLTMAMVPLGIVTRSTRSAVADVLAQDFVEMLRAKGMPPHVILFHAVRNALPQILAVMGLQLGYLIGGSILIETIFTWPGTGFLMSKAILTRDVPLLQGTILVLAMSFVLINLIVDLLQTVVDPRLSRS